MVPKTEYELIYNYAAFFARRNPQSLYSLGDFVNEGVIAFYNAKSSYTGPAEKWITYLASCVKNQILTFIAQNHAPVSLQANQYLLAQKIFKLAQKGQDKESILSELGITEEMYLALKDILKFEPLVDQIDDSSKFVDFRISEYTKTLSAPEHQLLQMHLEGLSIKQISEQKKCSYELIRRQLNNILQKIQLEYENSIINCQ